MQFGGTDKMAKGFLKHINKYRTWSVTSVIVAAVIFLTGEDPDTAIVLLLLAQWLEMNVVPEYVNEQVDAPEANEEKHS